MRTVVVINVLIVIVIIVNAAVFYILTHRKVTHLLETGKWLFRFSLCGARLSDARA